MEKAISIPWLARRSGLPSSTGDQMARSEAIVRSWVEAGIVHVGADADQKRELEIVRLLSQAFPDARQRLDIGAFKALGRQLRRALTCDPDLCLRAEQLDIIEDSRYGEPAFVRPIVLQRHGEPLYQVLLPAPVWARDRDVLKRVDVDAEARRFGVRGPDFVVWSEILDLTDARNYKAPSASWPADT